jgi:uncharacterized protein YycO
MAKAQALNEHVTEKVTVNTNGNNVEVDPVELIEHISNESFIQDVRVSLTVTRKVADYCTNSYNVSTTVNTQNMYSLADSMLEGVPPSGIEETHKAIRSAIGNSIVKKVQGGFGLLHRVIREQQENDGLQVFKLG